MISSFEAGTLTMVMINPILVVKTRLCVQYENEAPQTRYKGMMNGMAKIYREEGVRGLYRVCILLHFLKTKHLFWTFVYMPRSVNSMAK